MCVCTREEGLGNLNFRRSNELSTTERKKRKKQEDHDETRRVRYTCGTHLAEIYARASNDGQKKTQKQNGKFFYFIPDTKRLIFFFPFFVKDSCVSVCYVSLFYSIRLQNSIVTCIVMMPN